MGPASHFMGVGEPLFSAEYTSDSIDNSYWYPDSELTALIMQHS